MLNTAILLGTLMGILLVIGFFFAGIIGMTIALGLAIIINLVSYYHSDKIVLKLYKARPLDSEKINNIIENLAKNARIPKPKTYVIQTKIPNAFATGRNPKHAAVAVTEGLLNLDDNEVEGVLSHELAHIRNMDILVSTLAATIAGAIAYLAQIGYWALFMGGGRKGEGNLLGLVLIIIFAPIAALLVRLAISRDREYKADYTGALISKKPKALASALRKISSIAKNNPIHGSNATSHLWIVNPFKADRFSNLFSTHPSLEKRIEILEEMEI